MKRMKKTALQQIFRSFERTFRIWEGEGGEGGAGSSGGFVATEGGEGGSDNGGSEGGEGSEIGNDSGSTEGSLEAGKNFDTENYLGDKKFNPEQRPLRKFNRNGMSKQDIDKLIQEAGSELFMTAEEIAEAEKNAESKGKEGKETEKTDKKGDKTDKNTEETTEKELDPKDFFEKTGLTQKEFDVLPPKAQENLTKSFEEFAQAETKIKQAEAKYTALKTDTDTAMNDALIAARLEEIATGRAFVASKVTPFTEADILSVDKLLALDKKAEAVDLMNKMLQERAGDQIKHERAVLDRKVADTRMRSDAHTVLMDLGKIDPRLTVGDSDYAAILPGHKDFKVMNEIIQICKDHDITVPQIKKFGAEKIYALISKSKGWDKERDTTIFEKGKQTLLDKLKNPTKVRSLDPGKRSAPIAKTGKEQNAMTQEALVDEIADGNLSNWERLLEAADGNPRKLAELDKIRQQGRAKYMEKRR